MNLLQLQYYVTLAKVKNYTQAADILYITQPSLSQSISRLESELNTKLLTRSTVKVELTYAGEVFLQTAKQILELQEDVIKQIRLIEDTSEGTLSVVLPFSYSNLIMPPILQQFAARYPKVKISVTESKSSALVEELSNGQVDLILLDDDMLKNLPNHQNYTIDLAIHQDPMVFVLPPTHSRCLKGVPLPQRKNNLPVIDMEELKESKFVLLYQKHRIRKKMDDYFQKADFAPNVMMEANHLLAALYNAVCGKAVTIVPFLIYSRFESPDKGYAFLAKGYETLNNSYCIYSPNSPSAGIAKAFSDLVRQTLYEP